MSTFYYTDDLDVDSSFIDYIFYNSESREIVFQFTSGSLAGYVNVPENVFEAIKTENDSASGSVGSYYNRFFRIGYFGGLDVSLVDEFKDVIDEFTEDEEGSVVTESTEASVIQWAVGYQSETAQEVELDVVFVFAADEDDALAKFDEAANVLGWNENLGGFEVVSITKYF